MLRMNNFMRLSTNFTLAEFTKSQTVYKPELIQ